MMKPILAVAMALSPLAAAPAQSVDPVAYEALARGNFSAAETRLASRLERGSSEPGVLLNLAHLYARNERAAEAATLYRQVLGTGNVQMELADGRPAWSHDLAARGLIRLEAFASR